MYKMICLDLDGTLLNSKKEISQNNQDILNRLSHQGIKIVIATGRHLDFAKYLTNDLDNNHIIISNNGAGVFDLKQGKSYVSYIDEDLVKRLVNISMANDEYPYIYTDCTVSGWDIGLTKEFDTEAFINTIVRSSDRIRILNTHNDLKHVLSIVVSAPEDKLNNIIEQGKEELKNLSYHVMDKMYDNYSMLEIMDKNVSKWSGIKKIAEEFSINDDEIICFGDEVNDIEMLVNSGLGVGMKNAKEEVLRLVDRVTEFDNDNDGIYHFLKDIYY